MIHRLDSFLIVIGKYILFPIKIFLFFKNRVDDLTFSFFGQLRLVKTCQLILTIHDYFIRANFSVNIIRKEKREVEHEYNQLLLFLFYFFQMINYSILKWLILKWKKNFFNFRFKIYLYVIIKIISKKRKI